MKKLFLLKTVLLLCALIVGSNSLWAQSSNYNSNLTFSNLSANSTACTVVIGESGVSGVKMGTGSTKAASFTVTVQSGTTKLHVHAAGWSGKKSSLSVTTTATGVSISPSTTWGLTADSGISGSGTSFTLDTPDNASTSYYKEYTLSGVSSNTVITIANSSERAVVWGVNAEIPPTSIGLDQTSLSKTVGDDAVTLAATVLPAAATNKTVTWTSTNSGVASVTSAGVVSFNGAGEATITAKTYNNLTATCTVTVVAGTSPSASLSKSSLAFGDVEVGQEKEMTFTVTPANLEGNLTIACDNDKYTVTPTSISQSATTAQTITVTAAPTALNDDMDGKITISGGGISNQTVTLTATPFKKYTVSFSDGGSLTEASKASGITLPDRSDSGDYTFVGWSESNVAAGSASVTTIDAGETYYPADDCTLYPVYSYTSNSPIEQWSEITTVPTEGEYVIASSNNYAMKASISSSRFENATIKINAGSPATLDAAPDANYIWEISKPDSYFRIKNGSNYAGGTSNKNQGDLLTSASADLAKWTITYDSEFKFENYGRSQAASDNDKKWLRNNGSYGWATYGDSQDKAPRLFKKGYVNGSVTLYATDPVGLGTITLAAACKGGDYYYGTYSNASAFVVPEGLTVSGVTFNTTTKKIELTDYSEGDIVKAGEGVLVSSLVSGNLTVSLSDETGTSKDGNLLIGTGNSGVTASDMSDTDYYYYRLTMVDGTPGFWWKSDDGAGFTLAANKAYLKVLKSASVEARGFSLLEDGETTAICEVRGKMADEKGEYFNLNGQRVAQPTKGLYIVNGHKVIIK